MGLSQFSSHSQPGQDFQSSPGLGLCDQIPVIFWYFGFQWDLSHRISTNSNLTECFPVSRLKVKEEREKWEIRKCEKLTMGGWREVTEGSLCGSGFDQTYNLSAPFFCRIRLVYCYILSNLCFSSNLILLLICVNVYDQYVLLLELFGCNGLRVKFG